VLGAHFIGTATSEMAGQAVLAIQMEVILTGGKRRLRPIMMTTLTTSLALVPMALGFGEGAEMNAPMARVVIGGMLVSALFTTFFVPTLYMALLKGSVEIKITVALLQPHDRQLEPRNRED